MDHNTVFGVFKSNYMLMFSEDVSKKVASTMFNAAVCGCKGGHKGIAWWVAN